MLVFGWALELGGAALMVAGSWRLVGMALKSREVAGGASSRWLMTVVCRVKVTFVTAVECTVKV